ncbi:MAG: preprotein translocase subunit YajC [Firmicutes bacterium]|nr:preprotein translocase subunit YajC [Bacillota bacterium]
MLDIKPFILPVAFLVIFYFLLIRPQQKKDKKIKEMRKNLKVGDKITTIGGIIGTIKKINDEQVVIEVGSDKTRFAITKWAVGNLVEDKEEKDK